jgi:hypothetical protein
MTKVGVVLCSLVGCNAEIGNTRHGHEAPRGKSNTQGRKDANTQTSQRCRVCNCNVNGRRIL